MRRRVQLTTAFAVLCFLSGSAEANADVRIIETGVGTPLAAQVIEVYGHIQPGDAALLEKLIRAHGGAIGIRLNSMGGDVMAAMALGRVLRRERATVIMGPDQHCVSACVFVLAGAVDRWVFSGKIGIHRPFLAQDSATTEQQQKEQYARIENLVRSYLGEMNVDVRLYDDMFRVSPRDVRYLTEDELKAYGLQGRDPYYEQAEIAGRAAQLGIATAELLRRRDAARACGDSMCAHAIEVGISRQEYDRRAAMAIKACAGRTDWDWVRCEDRIIRGSVTGGSTRSDVVPEASGAGSARLPMVANAQLCRRLFTDKDEWTCDQAASPVPAGSVTFLTRVRSDRDMTVQHRWYRGQELVRSAQLRIVATPTEGYRTYSRYLVTAGDAEWRVELRTSDGTLLHVEKFVVR